MRVYARTPKTFTKFELIGTVIRKVKKWCTNDRGIASRSPFVNIERSFISYRRMTRTGIAPTVCAEGIVQQRLCSAFADVTNETSMLQQIAEQQFRSHDCQQAPPRCLLSPQKQRYAVVSTRGPAMLRMTNTGQSLKA